MKECLVTKLKAVVLDDNLELFGKGFIELEIIDSQKQVTFMFLGTSDLKVIGDNSYNVVISNPSSNTITKVEDGVFRLNGDDSVIDTSQGSYVSLVFPIGTFKLIFDKYKVYPQISLSNSTSYVTRYSKDYKYVQEPLKPLPYFGGWNNILVGNLKDLANTSCKELNINGKGEGLEGTDISELNNLSSITKISMSLCGQLEGNINTLNNHPNASNITSFSIQNMIGRCIGELEVAFGKFISATTIVLENANSITGDLEQLATNQVSNGRTTGTLVVKGNMNKVVNNPVGKGYTITFDSSLDNGYSISKNS